MGFPSIHRARSTFHTNAHSLHEHIHTGRGPHTTHLKCCCQEHYKRKKSMDNPSSPRSLSLKFLKTESVDRESRGLSRPTC